MSHNPPIRTTRVPKAPEEASIKPVPQNRFGSGIRTSSRGVPFELATVSDSHTGKDFEGRSRVMVQFCALLLGILTERFCRKYHARQRAQNSFSYPRPRPWNTGTHIMLLPHTKYRRFKHIKRIKHIKNRSNISKTRQKRPM